MNDFDLVDLFKVLLVGQVIMAVLFLVTLYGT